MVGYGNHTPVLKRSMEPELIRKLHSVAFRATKSECLDLPAVTDIIRTVELETTAVKVYRDLVKESYAELSGWQGVTVTKHSHKASAIVAANGRFHRGRRRQHTTEHQPRQVERSIRYLGGSTAGRQKAGGYRKVHP